MSGSLSAGTAYIDVTVGKTAGLLQGITSAAESSADAAKSSFLSRIGSLALGGALGNALSSGVSKGFELAKNAVFGFNSQMEQANIAFSTMLGSQSAATAYLGKLQDFAKSTPFEFSQLVKSSQQMMGMGIAARDVIPDLRALGDSVASVGGSAEQIDSVTLAFDQMSAKGTLDMGNLEQLMQNGVPNALKILADSYHVTTGQMIEMISAGKVQSADALPKLISGIEQGTASVKGLGGMMDRQSATMSGALSNISDAANQTLAKAFRPLFTAASAGAQHLAEDLGSPKITAAAEHVASSLGGVGKAAGQIEAGFTGSAHVEGILGDIGRAARQVFDIVEQGASFALPIVKDLFEDKLATAKQIITGVEPAVVDLAHELGPVLGETLHEVGDLVTEHVLPALNAGSNFIRTDVIPAVTDFAVFTEHEVAPVLREVGDIVDHKVLPTLGHLVDLAEQRILPALRPVIKDGFELLKQVVADLTPIVADLVHWFADEALPVLDRLGSFLIGEVIPDVLKVTDVFIKVLRPGLSVAAAVLRDVVIPAFKAGADITLGLVDAAITTEHGVSTAVRGIGDAVSWVWDHTVSPTFGFIEGGVHAVGTAFHDVFDGAGKLVSDGLAEGVALAKAPINGMIGLANEAIGYLDDISVSIPNWVPGVGGETWGINIPKIPKLADGGLVLPKPGGTVVRVAEAGKPEIVAPDTLIEAAFARVLATRPQIGRDSPLIGTVNIPAGVSADVTAELLYGKLIARGMA